ncbi:MAG: ribosomal protein S18-alanine N-acetyltransferase [Candidatus Zixiibacteriota bacterium]
MRKSGLIAAAGRSEMELVIRPMHKADLKRVMSLESNAFSDPWPLEAFREHINDPEAGALVAEREGEIVAYACYQLENHKLHLTNLAVDPTLRRKSIAKQVLAHILDLARDRECELVYLEVRISNEAARCFYEASAFRTVDRWVRYYRSPVEDALIMMRWINVAASDR